MAKVSVTKAEQKAIADLKAIAAKWPKSLELFSWSGSLTVLKVGSDGRKCDLGGIYGIPNDGGDPGNVMVCQDPDITYL